jgi:uncharacterized protein
MQTKTRMLTPVSTAAVRFEDGFWKPRQAINRALTLDTSYRHLKKRGTLKAYQWDWQDPARGIPDWRIWVGDLPKWLEACAYSLASHPDRALARRVKDAIAGIARGQKADGYLYANALPRNWRFQNLAEWHELYDLGHMIEGAVALAEHLGDRTLLDVVCRAVALVDRRFGWGKGQIRAADGHPEIELALVRLYRVTRNPAHLRLARFFVDVRGKDPAFYQTEEDSCKRRGIPHGHGVGLNPDSAQAHRPLRDQKTVDGHAVRALYLLAGAVDVAAETGDAALLRTCRRLWNNVTRRRMYVTGGVGSTPHDEAFTVDYDLPGESAYAETCASIALVFFAQRLLQLSPDGDYADVIERALYNGILSGVSMDGTRFFYCNRLTVYPRAMPKESGSRLPFRQEWFGCSCCPPNLARLLASVGSYVCSTGKGSVWMHQYAGGTASVTLNKTPVTIVTRTRYPWDGTIRLAVQPATPLAFTLALRIPGWARSFTLSVNGKSVPVKPVKGYAPVERLWKKGDRVELRLPMPVERIEARPEVRDVCGRVALQRGPVVYTFEEIDNGPELADLVLPDSASIRVRLNKALNAPELVARGARRRAAGWDDALYRPLRPGTKPVTLTAVPYAFWNNRGNGEMRVWILREPRPAHGASGRITVVTAPAGSLATSNSP